MTRDPLDSCAVRHVADFECFASRAKPRPGSPGSIPRGACYRCQRDGRLLQCDRCGKYHCAPELRAQRGAA
jgi:hypothetical protein